MKSLLSNNKRRQSSLVTNFDVLLASICLLQQLNASFGNTPSQQEASLIPEGKRFGDLTSLNWIIGRWRSEYGGKIVWPTVPTMTYGEELVIGKAPKARIGLKEGRFLNFSARAWSHSTKDHFHDEWGFLTVTADGNATLLTVGNNGFTTYEEGPVKPNLIELRLKDIGRISFSRDLPVLDLKRTFVLHDDTYLEQILEMRTATHPPEGSEGLLQHTRIIYHRID